MNKLLVSDIIDLKKGKYILEVKSQELIINSKEISNIYLINQNLNKLTINMLENGILNIYLFNEKINQNLKVIINQDNNSKIYYNASYLNDCDNKLEIDNQIKGNDNESHLNIRNISNNGLSKIIINVKVEKETSNNIAIEDLKGINNGGFVHIEPNIICLSNEVEANHLTTIGSLNNEWLNYLRSKGISLNKAKEMLLKGFIFSNMDEFIKENRGE